MSTVATEPKYGTIESFAQIIRQPYVHGDDGVYACLTGILRSVLDGQHDMAAERRLELVRNALAAAELVSAELRAARMGRHRESGTHSMARDARAARQ